MTWSYFNAKLFTVQKWLEATSMPNCTLRKNDLKLLQALIVPWTWPFLHRSRLFCTRAKAPWTNFNAFLYTCKTPWTNFNALLYTCKTVMQTFKELLFTMQNRPVNVQRPIVPCVKPLCKGSMPCSRHITILPERESYLKPLKSS